MNQKYYRKQTDTDKGSGIRSLRCKDMAIMSAILLLFFCGCIVGCSKSGQSDMSAAASVQTGISENESEAGTDGTAMAETRNSGESVTAAEEQTEDAVSGETPVEAHGQLSVSGTQIVDEYGEAYQLRGVSTHGIAWFPEYINYEAFQTLRDEWGVNAVRLAMYTAESGGYCTDGDPEYLKGLVESGVSYATELGMYVIIDWHVLNDNDPNTYKSEAVAFFSEMAELYQDSENVLYEICNEPCGGTTWPQIKSYAEEVIAAIRGIDSDAIIIVGTPNWSQQVDEAAADPISGYENIMYTLHFYAASHTDSLRQTMTDAIDAGLPVIVSEYGICDASGSGAIDEAQADEWVSTMDQYGVSYLIWNLSNKDETSALISSDCSRTSGWSYDELSDSGKWFVDMLGTADNGGDSALPSDGTEAEETAAEAPDSPYTVTAECTNEWSGDGGTHKQYAVEIRNSGGSDLENWLVTLTFSAEVSVEDGWCGNFIASGSQITITPESWNGTVAAGDVCSDVGLIVVTSGELTAAELTEQ